MSRFHDDATAASGPGRVTLSLARYRRLQPATQGLRGVIHRLGRGLRIEAVIDDHVRMGDSRAAMVVSTDPLLVAAYTDKLDAVSEWRRCEALARDYVAAFPARLRDGSPLRSAIPAR